tara:strand:+ start:593 stop:1606 length:1014 start_codon:yes stop_codon:yes gene_type:complete
MKINGYTKHSKKEYNTVMNLRRRYDWGSKRIFKYLSRKGITIKRGTIDGWIYRGRGPYEEVLIKPISKSSEKLTKEKAYILGVLCGDGWISTGYRIGLGVIDKEFADYFQYCLEKVYGAKCSRTIRKRGYTNFSKFPKMEYIVSLCSKLIVNDLNKYSKSFKSKEWKVSFQIKRSPKDIQAAFIRGLADSEAHVRCRKGQSEINICSGNLDSLKVVRNLLYNSFNIKSYLGSNGYDVPVIVIGRYIYLKEFYSNIGFVIMRKQNNLRRSLESYKRKGLRKYSRKFKIEAMNLLKKGMKHRQIAKLLGTNHTNIYDWEKQMLRDYISFNITEGGIKDV